VLAGLRSLTVLSAYVLIRVDFDEAAVVDLHARLPDNWTASPPTRVTQALGDAWIEGKRSVVLRVPSVLVPGEFNYLINPAHPDVDALRHGTPEPLQLDSRLLPH
jgi:RES domain-containing protein